jgi:hypothetical protein
MTKTVTAAIATAAIVAFAGAAQAANVCQWTGVDWACGDGKLVSSHVSETAGPPMVIKSVPTVNPNEKPLLSGPWPQ